MIQTKASTLDRQTHTRRHQVTTRERTLNWPPRTHPAVPPPPRAARAQPASARAEQPRPAGYRRAALLLILIASFMVVLDFSIVNVALPSIQRELGLAASAAQWVVTGYAITFGGLLILGGRAADLFGRRRMFRAGLIAFSAASLAGGLARDPGLLIAARAIQGAGAALVAPAALSLITTGFPEGNQRNKASFRSVPFPPPRSAHEIH